MDSKSLTTREVARLCQVSDATVKRWEEAGLIQSERTSGGHRRFRAEEIARFQREIGLGLKTCHGDESITNAASRRRPNKSHSSCAFFQSIVAGCETESANILINAFLQGEPLAKIFDESVSRALCRVGELWFNGELSVTQEHLATRSAFNALYKLRSVLPITESNHKLAMCCAMEGDLHELPPFLAQMTLENLGFEVVNFGANTPLYSFAEEVLQFSPALVCVSATVMENVERASRDYKDFRAQFAKIKTSVVLGGRAFNEQNITRRFPAELRARTFTELAAFAQVLGK